MRVENETKTRVWEDSSLCLEEPRLKMPFKNSILGEAGGAAIREEAKGAATREVRGDEQLSWMAELPESLLAGALLMRNELAQVVLALLHTLLQILLAVLQWLDLLLHKILVTTVKP